MKILKQTDEFINPRLTFRNFDLYLIRKSIFEALNRYLHLFQGNLLDIGCGQMPYRDYIISNSGVNIYTGLDIEIAMIGDEIVKPDYFWNGQTMPFKDNSFECAIGTEVLEHCPKPEDVLKETYRILKPGGIFFFTVPFLWNLHTTPHDQYRYTPFSIERHLRSSGFANIEIHAMGGWHSAMAQMIGLWVKRAPMPAKLKRILYILVYPVYRYLLISGRMETRDFKKNIMITGLYGIAVKR